MAKIITAELVDRVKCIVANEYYKGKEELEREDPQEYQRKLRSHVDEKIENWVNLGKDPIEDLRKKISNVLSVRFYEANERLAEENPQEYERALHNHIHHKLERWLYLGEDPLKEEIKIEEKVEKKEKPGRASVFKKIFSGLRFSKST